MFHLGSIGGTTIRIDASFLILAILFVVLNYSPEQGVQYALIWVPIIFLSVLIHELAHAAMIAIFGFGSSQIVLNGMGGVTFNQRRAKPWQDMLISLAGPLSSFGLMFLSAWVYYHVPHRDAMVAALLPRMYVANKFWAYFNLIPVAPLDGGHAVREFLNIFLRDRISFIIYVWIAMLAGGGIAVWFFLQRNFFIAIYIAWFVYIAFQQWQHFRQYGTPGD